MPRQKRADEAGVIYHALNRGNARQQIFHKQEDYEAFLRVVAEGLDRYPVELFSFTLMPNHWHLVLSVPIQKLSGPGRRTLLHCLSVRRAESSLCHLG